jgi:hypothetical protein
VHCGRSSVSIYRCPVCHVKLSQKQYEKALGILGEKEQHLRHQKAQLQAKLSKARDEARRAEAAGIRKERDRTQRILAGRDKEIQALQEQLKRLKKGTTPQTDGLEFEDRLYARLRREFSDDRIVHEGKGGDILHTVLVDGKAAGLILYECKRCKRIQSDHVEQATRDKRSRQADFAILVTTGTRRGYTGLANDGPVLVVSPLGVIALAGLLRAQLLQMSRARLSRSQKEKVAAQALEYITGPMFKGPLEDAITRTRKARGLLEKEAKAHLQVWQERWDLYQTVDMDLASLSHNSERISHGEKPVPVRRLRPTLLTLPAAT